MPVSQASPSVDPADVARFEAIGEDWWDPEGSMRPLHQINPLRIVPAGHRRLVQLRHVIDTEPIHWPNIDI